MKILGRRVRLAELPVRVQGFVLAAIRIFYHFRRPLSVLYHYIRSTSPQEGFVEFRSGMKIFMSGHRHDMITVVAVFCKMDYGKVDKGSVVLDIGANIGSFSLYAAHMGAKCVYAFEPGAEAYACLVKNVRENGLDDVVVLFKLAVTGHSGDQVGISTTSSPYNKIQARVADEHLELVGTISLDDILCQQSLERVDLVKMDCEGAEYVIVPAAQDETFSKIGDIRMEYHRGSLPSLISDLATQGFKVARVKKEHPESGIIWFTALDRT
jgi:FkbM family methyltransferase